ncbi:MAG: amino acid racemase [Chloroflexi bacterium]|nr:amino acid racemase [Chloroflexota bacterium]
MTQEKVIGILGGMGPEATADLFMEITRHTEAQTDQDHFRILVDSNAKIPSRQAAVLEGGPDPTSALVATARALEQAGADFLVIPCNSAHILLEAVQASVQIPILSIVEATVEEIQAQTPDARQVGLLASTAIVQSGLYTLALARRGMATLLPDAAAQARVLESIFAVKAGHKGQAVKAALAAVVADLVQQGAQAVILACTELPLVLHDGDAAVPLVNPTAALARAAVREAGGEAKLRPAP